MKLINIGCGRSFHTDWVNIDLVSSCPEVKQHDIRKNLPYSDAEFDTCYTSHVLEHLRPQEAERLIAECRRILKPQGIIRVVVPDLETIAREYLNVLEKVAAGEQKLEDNYDWMMLELYDQTVRSFPGGEMERFLLKSNLANKEFILSRIGAEAENYWLSQTTQKSVWEKISNKKPSWFFEKTRNLILKSLVRMIAGNEAKQAFEEGLFRNSGEIHRYMYDRFSLRRLLKQSGFTNVCVCRPDDSRITDFNNYNLDVLNGKTRKPDSLFVEAIKLL
ncbi:MAG: class I SAM-dependent methyltransferase [Dolichospermum sp.]